MRTSKIVAMFAAGVVAASSGASAQSPGPDWPNRKVDILVPTGAGGNTDIMARLAAEHLNAKLGQPFVVQNRPSAGGVLTSQQVSTADPDGYTLLFAPSSMIVLTPLVQNVPFNPDNLVPVTNVGTGVQVAVVKTSLPVKTLAEFFAHAKANPGKLNFASAGVNNISHLGPVLMFKRMGVELAQVVVRGEPQAVTELMSGNVDFYFGNTSVLLNTDREKIRLLAVGSGKRLASVPELPTVAETVPGFEFASWNGFFVPKGTPQPVVDKLRASIAELVGTPAMKERLTKLGIVPGGQSAAEVAETFKKDAISFAEAVKAAGVKKPEAKQEAK
jgi:tripartite-type tricarboxylate transporter receptor subunit TctC